MNKKGVSILWIILIIIALGMIFYFIYSSQFTSLKDLNRNPSAYTEKQIIVQGQLWPSPIRDPYASSPNHNDYWSMGSLDGYFITLDKKSCVESTKDYSLANGDNPNIHTARGTWDGSKLMCSSFIDD